MWGEAPLDVLVVIPGSLSRWWRAGVSRARPVKHQGCLVSLFFFPGVGVVDDQVRQWERSGCLGGGDQAVDRLGLPGKGIGGRAAPRGGQRDFSVLVRVGAVERGPPALGWRVVVADETRVLVRVDPLVPDQARGGRDRVGGAITPVVFVVRCRERDRDVAAQQVDHVGLGRVRDRDDCGNESVRI